MSDEPTPAEVEPNEVTESDVPTGEQTEDVDADTDASQFNVMSVESVLYDLSDVSPLVHLIEEETPYRYLAIPIALPEAVALHNALDKIDGRRPGTHEVMAEVLRRLNADIVAARITRYESGVFYAELDLMTSRGHEIFDCRTSDALILATRQGVRAPVLCAESVLQAFYA
jgi:bifunctional DNase/RNase